MTVALKYTAFRPEWWQGEVSNDIVGGVILMSFYKYTFAIPVLIH